MIYPMFAMTLVIFFIATMNMCWRILSIKNKQVRARYYKLLDPDGQEIPQHIVAGGKNYSNQFEVPILFYIASSLAIFYQQETAVMVSLAWLFVASRVIHACIHVSYNHLLHRLVSFGTGVVIVMIMWALLVFRLL